MQAKTEKTIKENNKKGAKTLWIILVVFLLPVAAAQLVLKFGWYQGGVTNHGTLLEDALEVPHLVQMTDKPKWMLIYPSAGNGACQTPCQHAQHLMAQIFTALGREQERVALFQLQSDGRNVAELDVADFKGTLKVAALEGFPVTEEPFVYIADPMGRVVLRYPVAQQKQQLALDGKGMLTDLKRLLKQSKIG